MKDLVIKGLQYAAEHGVKFYVEASNKIFTTYHDGNGQRQCKLIHAGYGDDPAAKKEMYPDMFTVIRHCSFVNKSDEGKDGAVLLNIYPNKLTSSDKCTISNQRIEFGGLVFHFYTDLEF